MPRNILFRSKFSSYNSSPTRKQNLEYNSNLIDDCHSYLNVLMSDMIQKNKKREKTKKQQTFLAGKFFAPHSTPR